MAWRSVAQKILQIYAPRHLISQCLVFHQDCTSKQLSDKPEPVLMESST